jgi:hypothetical protein
MGWRCIGRNLYSARLRFATTRMNSHPQDLNAKAVLRQGVTPHAFMAPGFAPEGTP